jgi:hypothetical protein
MFNATAQTFLKGYVYFESVQETSVNISNISQSKGTINNSIGRFSILAKIGDTINFSAVQLYPYQLIVNESHLASDTNLIILIPKIESLDEIVLEEGFSMYKKPLSKEVIENINLSLPFPNNPIPKSTEQKELDYGGSSFITGILSRGSKRLENIRKFIELDAIEKKEESVRKTFGDEFFIKIGVDSADIDYFIEFCTYNSNLLIDYDRLNYVQIAEILADRVDAFHLLLRRSEKYKEW